MPPLTPSSSTVTLLDLTEPVFQYICLLKRAAHHASSETSALGNAPVGTVDRRPHFDYAAVRAEIVALLHGIRREAARDFRLATQAKKMELPLIFFVDSMIAESRLPFAAQWNANRLAFELNSLAGDESFFDIVDETLRDMSEDASERLAVFFMCIGLGFSGVYSHQPGHLRNLMQAMESRLSGYMNKDPSEIFPEAYKTDTRMLLRPPSTILRVMWIVFLCLSTVLFVSSAYLYRAAFHDLKSAMEKVLSQEPTSLIK